MYISQTEYNFRNKDTRRYVFPASASMYEFKTIVFDNLNSISSAIETWKELEREKKKKEITHEITACLHVSSSPPIYTRILSYKIMEINSRVLLLVAVARLRRRRRLLRLLLRVRMMMMMHHVVVIVVVIVVHVHLVRVAVGRRARRDLTRQSVQRLKHFHRSPPGGRISVPPSLGLVHPWGTQDYSSFPVSTEPQQPPNSNRLRVSNRCALSRSLARSHIHSLSLYYSSNARTWYSAQDTRPVNIYIYIFFFLLFPLARSFARSLYLPPSTNTGHRKYTLYTRHGWTGTNLSLGKFCSTLLLHTLATVNARRETVG